MGLLIVDLQRDLQCAQLLRLQTQFGALLAVAVEHQHLLA